jgi:thiol-disulfide isomerase/thioredoxin
MDKKMFKIGYLVGVLLIIGVGAIGYFNMKSIVNETTIPTIELTQLDLENLDGIKIVAISGRPIVVNFWATWCVPCIKEFPQFEELKAKYANQVDFLMVSDEESSKIEKFKAKKGYDLNLIRNSKTFETFGLAVRPATYFYDADGRLISKVAGSISKEELEEEIKALIGR